MDPFCTPYRIFYGYTLNQGDGLGSQFGTTAAVTRLEFPEQSKAFAMPVQQDVGLRISK